MSFLRSKPKGILVCPLPEIPYKHVVAFGKHNYSVAFRSGNSAMNESIMEATASIPVTVPIMPA